MKLSRTLTLAAGSAVVVWIVVTYFFQGPPWPALAGAVGAVVWIVGKAWRKRSGSSAQREPETRDRG